MAGLVHDRFETKLMIKRLPIKSPDFQLFRKDLGDVGAQVPTLGLRVDGRWREGAHRGPQAAPSITTLRPAPASKLVSPP